MEAALVFVFVAVAALFYFVPSFVAATRSHQNASAILILNIFLGWSVIGWVVALVWAFTEVKPMQSLHTGEGLSDSKKGVRIVVATAVIFALFLLIIIALMKGSGPFVYTMF